MAVFLIVLLIDIRHESSLTTQLRIPKDGRYRFLYTVGARILNVFGFRMVGVYSVFKWFGFQMVLDKMAAILFSF